MGAAKHHKTASAPIGALYIVATPIGNLDDLTFRAQQILTTVDCIAAEDTRHSKLLLKHYHITTPLLSLHEFNENQRIHLIQQRISEGQKIALISDAGTPLIADPGFRLVRRLREADLPVIPIPGACAMITALSAAGLATDRFRFEGFLAAKTKARDMQLAQLNDETATTIFYEVPHRILTTLKACQRLFPERQIVLARELTKKYETFLRGTATELSVILADDQQQQRGEFVLLIAGNKVKQESQANIELLIQALIHAEVSTKQAARVLTKMFGDNKQYWYQHYENVVKSEK